MIIFLCPLRQKTTTPASSSVLDVFSCDHLVLYVPITFSTGLYVSTMLLTVLNTSTILSTALHTSAVVLSSGLHVPIMRFTVLSTSTVLSTGLYVSTVVHFWTACVHYAVHCPVYVHCVDHWTVYAFGLY